MTWQGNANLCGYYFHWTNKFYQKLPQWWHANAASIHSVCTHGSNRFSFIDVAAMRLNMTSILFALTLTAVSGRNWSDAEIIVSFERTLQRSGVWKRAHIKCARAPQLRYNFCRIVDVRRRRWACDQRSWSLEVSCIAYLINKNRENKTLRTIPIAVFLLMCCDSQSKWMYARDVDSMQSHQVTCSKTWPNMRNHFSFCVYFLKIDCTESALKQHNAASASVCFSSWTRTWTYVKLEIWRHFCMRFRVKITSCECQAASSWNDTFSSKPFNEPRHRNDSILY